MKDCTDLVMVINVIVIKDLECTEQDKEFKKKSLMPPHTLTDFEIEDYFKDEPRFNSVSSRDNLPKTIKNGAYVINLDHSKNTGTNWVVLFVKNNEVIYFDSFGVEHILREI